VKVVIEMSDKEQEEPDEEDWMKYANAGFGKTDYTLWDDAEATTENTAQPIDDGHMDDGEMGDAAQLTTHVEEIPRAPSPAGHKHLVRIGTCDHCLGRIGGKKMFDQSIQQAGENIRTSIIRGDSHLEKIREDNPLCPFCENLYQESALLADIIYDSLKPYELKRVQLGARFPKDQIENEEEIRKRFGAGGSDALKTGLVAEIAKNLSDRLEGVKIVSDKPQIVALIDVLTLTVELDIRSVYIYGRYQKLERGIPQTRWPCRACKGRGCTRCNQTGLQYLKSVQDLIGNPLIERFGAIEHSFHGMGREDIDVRCMGTGRPFVIEFKAPKTRTIDLVQAMADLNEAAKGSVIITSMRESNRSEVVRIKETPAEKSYSIRFKLVPLSEAEFAVLTGPVDLTHIDVQERGKGKKNKRRKNRRGDKDDDHTKPLPSVIETEKVAPSEEELLAMKKGELVELATSLSLSKTGTKAVLVERIMQAGPPAPEYFELPTDEFIRDVVDNLAGVKLAQRTPERVAHRRADLIRRRVVYETNSLVIETNENGEREIEFTLRCESGTYVKETIHGDSGRTQPSISSLIKAKCDVIWLDVADIHAD